LEGINVAIVGRTNVGKSSLLNALLNENRVIVSNTPGTTRDVVNAKININGITFNFQDTVGYRKTNHHIEKMGMNKTLQTINNAEVVLWVVDGSQQPHKDDLIIKKLIQHKKYFIVKNKSDLNIKNKIKGITISAKNKQISKLIYQLSECVQNVK
jgi:tRNA modification GTPase